MLDDEAGASDAKVIALQNLHSQKIRALMKSIDKYKREVKTLSSQNRESSRSRQIQGLQSQLRGAELVCDLLKEELCTKLDMTPLEVNQWVFNKSIGGPKRFRPKTREALFIELEQLKKQHDRAVVKAQTMRAALKEEQEKARTLSATRNASRSSLASEGKAPSPSSVSSYGAKRTEGKEGATGGADYSRRVVELLGQIDALRQQSEVKDRQIRTYVSKVETLHEAKRELIGYKDKYERSRGKHAQLSEEVERLNEESITLRRQLERPRSSIFASKLRWTLRRKKPRRATRTPAASVCETSRRLVNSLRSSATCVLNRKARRDVADAHQQRLSGTKRAEVATGQLGKQLKGLESERDELKAELKRVRAEADGIKHDAGLALKQSNSEMERKLQVHSRTIAKLTKDREEAEKEAVRCDQRVQSLEKQINQQMREFSTRTERLEAQLRPGIPSCANCSRAS